MSVGLALAVEPVDIDESVHDGEPVRDYAVRLAAEKGDAAVARLGGPKLAVLAADTIVSLGNRILGKPADEAQAAEMLGMKRGEFFDLLHEHHLSPVQMSVADLEKDFQRG